MGITRRSLSWTSALTIVVASACGGTSFVNEDGQGGTGALAGDGGTSANGGSGGSTGGAGSVGGSVSSGGSGNVGGSVSSGGSGNVGGTGAVGGDGGVGGVSATGGTGNVSGTGGVAGTPAVCTDPDAASLDGGISTRVATVGTNGSFTDYCDDGGNLIEHYCEPAPCDWPPQQDEAFPAGASGIGIPCPIVGSGLVIELPVDCGGNCREGACERYCTDIGQTFTVESVSVGESIIAIDQFGQHVGCSIIAEFDGFLCTDASLYRRVMTVVGPVNCTPAGFAMGVTYAGTTDSLDCSYTCMPVDPPPEI